MRISSQEKVVSSRLINVERSGRQEQLRFDSPSDDFNSFRKWLQFGYYTALDMMRGARQATCRQEVCSELRATSLQ